MEQEPLNDTLATVQEVFRETFQDDRILLTRETTAAQIEDWDSLMHVTLMVSLETKFGIRFSSSEVASFKNVGELIDLVEARTQ
jgi:acyl carrier protein